MSNYPYEMNKNEPKEHSLIKNSFASVHSVGMRLAPEILVMELYREIFFENHFQTTGAKNLNPDECNQDRFFIYSKEERAILYALQGRRKKTKNSKSQRFFAPAYPSLARECWLRKKSDRVVNYFLLGGVIGQHLWQQGTDVKSKKEERDEIIKLMYLALNGHNSYGEDNQEKDILSVALEEVFDVKELALQNLKNKTEFSDSVIRTKYDELSNRIFNDLVYLCKIEKELPRMQWMHILMTFLRFSIPMWLLAQMKITSFLHEWLIDAIDNNHVVSTEKINQDIAFRNRGVLHLALTPTREVFDRVEQFMKHRIELRILISCLAEIREEEFNGKGLTIGINSADKLSVERLLEIARDASLDLKESQFYQDIAPNLDVRRFLIRAGEIFPSWRNPLRKGQGKNIDEFLRVMYKDELGDEAGGYLLIPEGRGQSRGFRVLPGQLLLKMITYFAFMEKHSHIAIGGGGKLVIGDVENHFHQYGVDFSSAADARPLLMREMQAMGLLKGSPDAGSSVAVSSPY